MRRWFPPAWTTTPNDLHHRRRHDFCWRGSRARCVFENKTARKRTGLILSSQKTCRAGAGSSPFLVPSPPGFSGDSVVNSAACEGRLMPNREGKGTVVQHPSAAFFRDKRIPVSPGDCALLLGPLLPLPAKTLQTIEDRAGYFGEFQVAWSPRSGTLVIASASSSLWNGWCVWNHSH